MCLGFRFRFLLVVSDLHSEEDIVYFPAVHIRQFLLT